MVRTGSSYASQSELPLTLGLGKPEGAEKTVTLEILWPSGERMTLQQVRANQSLVIQEGQGIIKAEPVVFARAAPTPAPTPAPTTQP
jgi:hypothetical protein